MIWLIGNKGMLGTELSLLLEKEGVPFVGTDREVDITDEAALLAYAQAAGGGVGQPTSLRARSEGPHAQAAGGGVVQPTSLRSRSEGPHAQAAGGQGKIDWIINCAAYTAVDKAEDDRGSLPPP